jgi:hypothetical protein
MPQLDQLTIRLATADARASRLQELTRDMADAFRQQNVGCVTLPEQVPQTGSKGDPVAIGQIILTLIGAGGVAVSLVNVLRSYVERKPTLKIEMSRSDGKKLSLQAENLSTHQLAETTKAVQEFLAV